MNAPICVCCMEEPATCEGHCDYCIKRIRKNGMRITSSWYWPMVDEEATDKEFYKNPNPVKCRFLGMNFSKGKVVIKYSDGSIRTSSPNNINTNYGLYSRPPVKIDLFKDHSLFYLVDCELTIKNEGYDPSEYRVGSDKVIYYKCINPECGNSHLASVYQLINKLQGRCKECAREVRDSNYSINHKLGTSDKQIDVPDLKTLDFSLPNERSRVQCETCDFVFESYRCNLVSGNKHYHTNGCIKCWEQKQRESTSNFEKSVVDFVRSLNVEFETQKSFSGSRRRADLYLPNQKIVIACDGSYWHKDDKNNLLNSTLFFAEHGLRTIHIFDFEWREKNDLLKNKLASIILRKDRPVVRANKVLIKKQHSSDIIKQFYKDYHFMGHGESTEYNYCVWDKDKLIGICSFLPKRSQNTRQDVDSTTWELTRFASTHKIYGILPKILKRLKKDLPHIEHVISYADLRWTNMWVNFYTLNGFKQINQTTPNYSWICNFKRLSRYQTQRHKLEKMFGESYPVQLTENMIMQEHGFHQVFDCGNLVYEISLHRKKGQ